MPHFQYDDATLELDGNRGTVTLYASNPRDALERARRIFRHMRDVSITGTAERYFVEFKVSFKHNRRLFRKAGKLAKLDLTRENYERLEPTEQYMALLYAHLSGKPTFLGDPMFLRGALLSLKNEMIHQDQVSGADGFMDYDIAVYNLVESQA